MKTLRVLTVLLLALAAGCGDSTEPAVTGLDRVPNDMPDAGPDGLSKVESAEHPGDSADDKSTDLLNDEMSEADAQQFVSLLRPQVQKFCGDCHVMPRPSSSPATEWHDEVEQGFMLYRTSGRSDLDVPDQQDVLKWFRLQAPATLELPASIDDYPQPPFPMRVSEIHFKDSRPSGVTNLNWMDIGLRDTPAIVYCDIGTGAVKAHWPQEEGTPTLRLATLFQPVHVESCDLDDDGHLDLVVADIGEFNADDSDLGQVIWLRRVPGEERFEKIVVQEGLSRVSDARLGDFDNDGDVDLLVATFGWRKTGRTFLLENNGVKKDKTTPFTLREIDDRHGPVHVPPVDLNGDGHLDFVALISQDQEVVEAFINDGTGHFKSQLIYQAPDPAYGSSGIELVDMDGDDDLDVLYTNGDSFDRGPKPYHSVQWLENEGTFPYTHHEILLMPGVLNAAAGDIDGDGDIDLVGASLLAGPVNDQLATRNTSSVVLLQQTQSSGAQRLKFQPFQLERGTHQHLSVELGDFDDDGDLDVATGIFRREGSPELPDLKIWWNEAPSK